jgi:hypothetical protein
MIRTSILSALLAFLMTPEIKAQTEAILQDYFGDKNVIAKLDMPGTNEGVDLDPIADSPGRISYDSYQKRLKQFGTAIHNGDIVTITKIKLKDKHLEFHLNGGGYGTFGDSTDPTASWTPHAKSSREIDLENRIKKETSPDKRDRLKHELDDVRRDRQRRDEHRRREAEAATREKAAEIQLKRDHGGSRFNVRFADKPTERDLTPAHIMNAFQNCLIFSWPQTGEDNVRHKDDSEPQSSITQPERIISALKKGMSLADVDSLLGAAVSRRESQEGSLKTLHCVYETAHERIITDFINGTLIWYSISPK